MCIATATYASFKQNFYNMQHENNCCNIRLKPMKHLEHTLVTYVWNICNIQIENACNHTSNTDENFLTNTCNISLRYNQHVQNPRSTFATFIWSIYNVAQHLLATWENGGSSAYGVHRRQRCGSACRQRPGGTCRWRAGKQGLHDMAKEAVPAWQEEGARSTKEAPVLGLLCWSSCRRCGVKAAQASASLPTRAEAMRRPPPLMLRPCRGCCVGTLARTTTRERWKERVAPEACKSERKRKQGGMREKRVAAICFKARMRMRESNRWLIFFHGRHAEWTGPGGSESVRMDGAYHYRSII
jgi:hypothetical protein